jgi:hypothetical protein
MPIIRSIQKTDITSLGDIAEVHNNRGVPTARGGRWHVSTVMNLAKRSTAVSCSPLPDRDYSRRVKDAKTAKEDGYRRAVAVVRIHERAGRI